MEPTNDAETLETQGEVTTAIWPSSQILKTTIDIPGTLSHDGRYIQYNLFGHIFELPAKYKPPIRPIGRGACGIVW